MDTADAARLGRHQSIVRSLNERLDDGLLVPSAPLASDVAGYLCECSNLDCTALVYVAPSTYDEVRSDVRRFVVSPGHEILEIERVVARGRDYRVVEKVGAAAIAVERDATDGGPQPPA